MEINCLHFDSLGSTNQWSKENYKDFDPKTLTIVMADHQTAGRGRNSRTWLSPEKLNIYATFTFFIEKGRNDLFNITQVAALSVVKTLEGLGFHPQLKWPNDIQLNKKKISGVLCEVISEENRQIVMVGIGLNINMPAEMLAEVNQPATSLLNESGKEFQVPQVMASLQTHFVQDLELFLQEGFRQFLAEYRKKILHKKGDNLVINSQKGTFQAVDNDGALVLLLQNCREQKFYAGEIIGS